MHIDLKAIFTGMGCWTSFGLIIYGIYRLGKSIKWPKIEWPLWIQKAGGIFAVVFFLVLVITIIYKFVGCTGAIILGYEIPSCY